MGMGTSARPPAVVLRGSQELVEMGSSLDLEVVVLYVYVCCAKSYVVSLGRRR